MKDKLDRYIFEMKDLRACYVRLEQSLIDNHGHQDYPENLKNLLGEFMAACAALSSSLKFKGRLVLQLRSDSHVPLLMAECNNEGKLRAYAQVKNDSPRELLEAFSFSDLKNGVLALTLQPDAGESYQGIVPLDGDNLSKCLQHYFRQSEQLESHFFIYAHNGYAFAFMLQQLPAQIEVQAEQRQAHWEEVQALVSTLREEELLTLESHDIMHRLFHQDEVRFLEQKPLAFACGCSKQKMEQALVSLGEAELRDIIREQGRIDMQCEFCQSAFVFDASDVDMLFAGTVLH